MGMWLEKRRTGRSAMSALRRGLPCVLVCGAVFFVLVSPASTSTAMWKFGAARSGATLITGHRPSVRAQAGPYVIFITPGPSNRDFNLSFMNPGPGTVNGLTIQWVGGVISTFGVDGVPGSACRGTGVEDAFACYPLSDGPGQTLIGHGTTVAPIPEGAPFIVYSTTDSFITATRHDVAFQTPPCECLTLTGQIVPSSIKFTNPGETGGMHLEFTVSWTMTCTAGKGGCHGTLDLVPPAGKGYKSYFKRSKGSISCNGPCAATSRGIQHFVLIGNRGLGGDKRGKAVRYITITVKPKCGGKALRPELLALVFDKRTALVDKKKSKLK